MHIDRYKQQDGWYKYEDGCDYESAADLIQTGIFSMCGCGNPEDNLRFIRDGLEHIEALRQTWDKTKTYEEWRADELRIFGNDRIARFFYYWADAEGLTEHGGAIPGWLDTKGRELLEDLRELCPTLED